MPRTVLNIIAIQSSNTRLWSEKARDRGKTGDADEDRETVQADLAIVQTEALITRAERRAQGLLNYSFRGHPHYHFPLSVQSTAKGGWLLESTSKLIQSTPFNRPKANSCMNSEHFLDHILAEFVKKRTT